MQLYYSDSGYRWFNTDSTYKSYKLVGKLNATALGPQKQTGKKKRLF